MMYNYLYRTYASQNPAGIEINLGWYALAECIIRGTYSSTALFRWCGLHQNPKGQQKRKITPTKRGGKWHPKTDQIIALYFANPVLKNKDIAKMVGCTQEMVSKVLIKIGIRRNRWDGYISQDKRYSQNKRRTK